MNIYIYIYTYIYIYMYTYIHIHISLKFAKWAVRVMLDNPRLWFGKGFSLLFATGFVHVPIA